MQRHERMGGKSRTTSPAQGAEQAQVPPIPKDLNCVDCSIRLVRQALEWGTDYMFYSCADVDIADKVRNDCSGHGRNQVGRCRCDKSYWGDRCQYKDECVKDGDCGRHGLCVETGATGGDQRIQCYCQLGWFGENCRKRRERRQRRPWNWAGQALPKLGS